MCPANERRRYNVTTSLIGWAHIETDAWVVIRDFDHVGGVDISWANIELVSFQPLRGAT